jgi:hypothetical protein
MLGRWVDMSGGTTWVYGIPQHRHPSVRSSGDILEK